jgi:hypothetical protein
LTPNQDNVPLIYSQRALELRLSVVAFYSRCAHFSFTTSTLQAWSPIEIQEYDLLVANSLESTHVLADFDGSIPSFSENTEDRIKWDLHILVLIQHFVGTFVVPSSCPPKFILSA